MTFWQLTPVIVTFIFLKMSWSELPYKQSWGISWPCRLGFVGTWYINGIQQGSQSSSQSSPHSARRCCPCLGIMWEKFLEPHNCHLAHLASPACLHLRRMDPVTFRRQAFVVLGIRNLPPLHGAAMLLGLERGKGRVLDVCRLPIPVCFHQRQRASFRMLVMYFRSSKLVAAVWE